MHCGKLCIMSGSARRRFSSTLQVTHMRARYLRVPAACLIGCFLAAALPGTAMDKPEFVRITPADVHWQNIPDGHGAQQAVLLGDPDKPGIYVIRAKFPPYVMDRPHSHPNARYVTVLE